MSIRVGLIGYGLSGKVFHAPFIVHDANMTLAYVCTSKHKDVKSAWPDAKVVSEAKAVFLADDVDLVVITTPNALHFEQAKQALEKGKHVLLEKPSVTSVAQIKTLCTLAKQKDLVFCVYQNRRFDGDVLRLKALIDSGELGELKHLDSRFDRFRPVPQARWREEVGLGTGIFWDLGPHLLDQILCLFGEPVWLQASMDSLRQDSQTCDWFELELGYRDKRICLGSTPFEAAQVRRFNARFTKGSWQCLGLDPQEEALRAGQMPWDESFPSKGENQTSTRYTVANGIKTVLEQSQAGQYSQFYRQLREAILGKGAAPVSMNQSCQLIYGLCLAQSSADKGQRMVWDYTPYF